MTTVSNVVKDIINRQVFLQEALNNDIISFNKLATNIKPKIEAELGHPVKLAAIIMAIRRHAEKSRYIVHKPKFNYFIETIKTDLVYIAIEESPNLLEKIQTLYTIVDFKKGGILNIIQGNFEIVIITNKKYKEDLIELLHDEKTIEIVDDLVSISLTYSKDFIFIPGVLYEIIRLLTWDNINIFEVILTTTEMCLIINKKDILRCYETLGGFSETSDEKGKIRPSSPLNQLVSDTTSSPTFRGRKKIKKHL